MRALAVAFALLLAAPASGAQLLVVGRHGTLAGPRAVAAKRTRIAGCHVPARTPLAALLSTRLKVRVRDYGACAPSGLYVRSVAGQAERGRDGWVYKVGNSAPGTGAAATRARGRVLWFWCHSGTHGCQRTLAVAPDRDSVNAGGTLRVTVTAYDDNGKGVRAAGARVTFGSASAVADGSGVATLTAPAGARRVVATQTGRVRSFAARVRVT